MLAYAERRLTLCVCQNLPEVLDFSRVYMFVCVGRVCMFVCMCECMLACLCLVLKMKTYRSRLVIEVEMEVTSDFVI